jgi:hypothetical protein
MRYRLIFFLFILTAYTAQANDSLQISFTKTVFKTADTIEFRCFLPYYAQSQLSNATLNVWIEDLEKTKRWKFRYPIINGEVDAALAISDKIPDGRYAISFLVQYGFFRIFGEVKDHLKKDTAIYYMLIQKNNSKMNYFDMAHVEANGNFRLKSTLFSDSAFFIFSPAKKTRLNDLAIKIETPLDSVFTPVLSATQFITVGDPKMLVSKKTDTSGYILNLNEQGVTLLPGVTVTSIAKKKVDLYDEQFSSGLFRKSDVIIFDGLESNDIANSVSLLQFLQVRVAGLTIGKDANGQDIAKWRDVPVEIYIDEFRVDNADHTLVATSDIAMIKVFRPPAMLSSSSAGAGAIAIYTKKGGFANDNGAKHNFVVKGYTPIESVWQ